MELVNTEPSGIGESILLQDADSMFANWKRVAFEIRPDVAWGALSHLEAGNFHRRGDAPVVWALGQSSIPAGSPVAESIYARTHQAGSATGNAWDTPRVATGANSPRRSDYPSDEAYFTALDDYWANSPIPTGGSDTADSQALVEAGIIPAPETPEDHFSLFGALKGMSRWAFLALDVIPEGFDAVSRAAVAVKSGDLSVGEAIGGIFGGQASEQVGIPLFSYLHDAWAGNRLNMGTGWFAEGEVADDIKTALAQYDTVTWGPMDENGDRDPHGGLTQQDFDRLSAYDPGEGLLVQGLGGKTYRALSLSEWKFLRDNVGRAALLNQLIPQSAEQQALGVAHGAFQEQIFDEATVTRQPKSGRYFSQSSGRGVAAGVGNSVLREGVMEPGTHAFDVVSGALDLGKQLYDAPILLTAKGAGTLIKGASRFIGLSGEAADLARATSTANKIIRGADHPVFGNVLDDIFRGSINTEKATNVIARTSDEALTNASATVGALRNLGVRSTRSQRAQEILDLVKSGVSREKAINMAGKELTPAQIDALVRRAANGDPAARAWAAKLIDSNPSGVDSATALDNLVEVTGRGNVDLVAGRFGDAVVDDTVRAAARSEVDDLQRVINERKGWAIPDGTPRDPFRVTMTFDADLGRAQKTLDDLRKSAPKGDTKGMITRLLGEHWATKRWAEKLLGDTDEAAAEVENLQRVLRRMDGGNLVTDGAGGVAPKLDPSRLSTLLSGDGKARAMVDSLAAAKNHREVRAILGPTTEFSGRISPALIDALATADDAAQVTEVLMKLGQGVQILPPKMALLGKAARFANLSTVTGLSAGAIAGGAQEAAQGGNPLEIAGGAFSGAVFGVLGGSALGSVGGYLFGTSTRRIEDISDALDLLLAGTRETTAATLRLRGVDMGRAQAGLGIPEQLSYGLGSSPLGRRLMRSAATNMNLSDPVDIYYKMADYTQSLGMNLDEEVTLMVKQVGEGDNLVRKVVRSGYKTTDEYEARIAQLRGEGFERAETLRMNDVFSDLANLTPNNPASAYRVLRSYGRVVDAKLADQGLPEEYRKLITHFTGGAETEFLGTLDASGRSAARMQYVVNGEVADGSLGARLESELWSGHIELPAPEKVQRAVNQLDRLGRTTQLFTGKGVLPQLNRNLAALATGGSWTKITPELERNIATRTARHITGAFWAPVVLLGRPFAFLSRVLGEDQARMTAAGLPNMFTHPISYLGYITGNYDQAKKWGRLKGVASRSIIPDEIIAGGRVNADVLDNMTHWDLAEEARHALNIYDRRLSQERQRLFGRHTWTTVDRGSPLYLDYLTTEIRQLVADPMVRHLARSTAEDPVEDTLRWLTETSQGQKVAHDWARQFKSEQQAAVFMEPDNLRAFLHDQYARLHLKTGGDWVFVWNGAVTPSDGRNAISQASDEARQRGWDQLDNGYHIYRKGDEELLDIVGTGKMKNVRLVNEEGVEYYEEALRIRDHLTDEKWDAIKTRITEKRDAWERHAKTQAYNETTAHRFPRTVKGSRSDALTIREKAHVGEYWDTAIDRFYDFILGTPSRIFSRQPVFGNYYWERIGMLYPSMTEDMKIAYKAIAEKEGVWRHVKGVANGAERAGVRAPGTLDGVHIIDTNAKAYAIERTRDILFDLHRQRNFIDGMRIVMPFAGPFVEALEAWTRLIRTEPLTVWRRGGQIVQHLWNSTGIGDQADPMGTGWFYTDPDGTEKFIYPFIGRAIPSWLNKGTGEGQPPAPLEGRARGLNIVFGTEDLAAEDQPTFAGFPIAAFNAGIGPTLQMAVAPFLKDREGITQAVYSQLFPFGTPENPTQLMPYNLRKLLEGNLGAGSYQDLTRHTVEQFATMVAGGEIGEGSKYSIDLSEPGGVDRAMEEARSRAIAANWFEGLARTILPTLTTPESLVKIKAVPGLDAERVISIGAFADYARELYSEEGAQWWYTPDGYRLSTEGDWEIITAYMNEQFGTDMFSSELLSLPLTDRPYPLIYTKEGEAWLNQHRDLVTDMKASGPLLMPNYAAVKATEDTGNYDPEVFEQSVKDGLAKWFTPDEHKIEIESRLLKAANRRVEIEAIDIFGNDANLTTEQKDRKAAWVTSQKQLNAGRYAGGDIDTAQAQDVLDEIYGWPERDWSKYDLNPDEQATVVATLWYLDALEKANNIALANGVRDITLKGAGEEEQAVVTAIREDLTSIVSRQLDHAAEVGLNMGNFPYIWERFLSTDIGEPDSGFDPLEALASLRGMDVERDLVGAASGN